MSWIDIISTGIKNLWTRKSRTLLTTTSVIIGVTSIIAMVSVGIGFQDSFNKNIMQNKSLNIIQVYAPGGSVGLDNNTISLGQPKTTSLDAKMIDRISTWQGVDVVTPIMEKNVLCTIGHYRSTFKIIGLDPDSMKTLGYAVSMGRLLENLDKYELVVGSMVQNTFYDPRLIGAMQFGPTGKSAVNLLSDKLELSASSEDDYGDFSDIKLSESSVMRREIYDTRAVGVLVASGDERDLNVYMNIEGLKKILRENDEQNSDNYLAIPGSYQKAIIRVKNIESIKYVQSKIRKMGMEATNAIDMLDSAERTSKMIQVLLGGIGAISLVVSSIGISNTMIMAVNERTKEIGIMKVLGASFSDLRRLFLFEAAFIGGCGGIAGTVLSYASSNIINEYAINFLSNGYLNIGTVELLSDDQTSVVISVIPIWLPFLAVLVSVLMGITSGFYPAWRAMRLSAIEAIRIE